ncbi:unnamed protein product [Vicia faba]|uniref:AMP-dependent synthetase/ligase domain-containing protein n=1 Tax=Vicia faba TaxID=3906 RepID=A0AAV1BAP9_VICFA|nr:unnamed protein product [Vicia faba]
MDYVPKKGDVDVTLAALALCDCHIRRMAEKDVKSNASMARGLRIQRFSIDPYVFLDSNPIFHKLYECHFYIVTFIIVFDSSVHDAISGGGGCLPSHVKKVFEAIGVNLQNVYGLTERSTPIMAVKFAVSDMD